MNECKEPIGARPPWRRYRNKAEVPNRTEKGINKLNKEIEKGKLKKG